MFLSRASNNPLVLCLLLGSDNDAGSCFLFFSNPSWRRACAAPRGKIGLRCRCMAWACFSLHPVGQQTAGNCGTDERTSFAEVIWGPVAHALGNNFLIRADPLIPLLVKIESKRFGGGSSFFKKTEDLLENTI